jgi:hypothetical protein
MAKSSSKKPATKKPAAKKVVAKNPADKKEDDNNPSAKNVGLDCFGTLLYNGHRSGKSGSSRLSYTYLFCDSRTGCRYLQSGISMSLPSTAPSV